MIMLIIIIILIILIIILLLLIMIRRRIRGLEPRGAGGAAGSPPTNDAHRFNEKRKSAQKKCIRCARGGLGNQLDIKCFTK